MPVPVKLVAPEKYTNCPFNVYGVDGCETITTPLPDVVENGFVPSDAVKGDDTPPHGPVPQPLLEKYVADPVGNSY